MREQKRYAILIGTAGSLGDLHPYIAVAKALIARGHGATIAAAADYRALVASAGVGFVGLRPTLDELGGYATLVPKLFNSRRGPEYLIRRVVMPHLRTGFEALRSAAAKADLLVSHPLAITLPLLAQQRGLPWVSTVLSPISLMSAFDPPRLPGLGALQGLRRFGPLPTRLLLRLAKWATRRWEAPLEALRDDLHLPQATQRALFEGQFSPRLNLALFDSLLAEPQPDWPQNTRVCGAPVHDGRLDSVTDAVRLEEFLAAGDAPIVFALGSSAVWIARDFWHEAVTAAQRLGRRALLVTGPQTPSGFPDSVCVLPYVPYSQVFGRAAAVVHHAGIGTLSQALRAARPQLLLPVAFDQPDNAHRAVRLGVARTLPFRRACADRLTTELAHLLADGRYARSAATCAAQLAGNDGAATAADALLECLVGMPENARAESFNRRRLGQQ